MPKELPSVVKFNGTPIKETAFANGWSLVSYDDKTYTFSIRKGNITLGIYLTTLTVRVVDKQRKWGSDQIFIKGLSIDDVIDLILSPEEFERAFTNMTEFRKLWDLN